ncbi:MULTISPECIES: general stress protein [Methylosinus]|nr:MULTISPECIES: KGG domain-containing protein [Methylosinus]OBS51539.1 stress-induced protein [Methylosinus sp. 3S-1]
MQKGQAREPTGREAAKRGFAAMDEAKQREIARKGGESVPAEKRSFSKDHDLAAQAGRKGGQSVPAQERSFSKDRNLAAEAGREGGKKSSGPHAKTAGSESPSKPGRKSADS